MECREKDLAKALAAQEKEVLRMRQREAQSGPRDDEDIEWQNLLDAQRSSDECAAASHLSMSDWDLLYRRGSDSTLLTICHAMLHQRPSLVSMLCACNGRYSCWFRYLDVPEENIPPPQRPAFPPATLRLQPAFPAQLHPHSEQLLHLWGFLHSFGDILGMTPLTLEELAAALTGASSRARHALAQLHISLLRLLQADMEESHATGAMQVCPAVAGWPRQLAACGRRSRPGSRSRPSCKAA